MKVGDEVRIDVAGRVAAVSPDLVIEAAEGGAVWSVSGLVWDIPTGAAVERKAQRQDSLFDQLRDLVAIANREGMYDAADHLRRMVEDTPAWLARRYWRDFGEDEAIEHDRRIPTGATIERRET